MRRSLDQRRLRLVLTVAVAAAIGLTACGNDGDTTGPTGGSGPAGTPTPSGPRPASTAELTIVAPTDGEMIEGSVVALKVGLEGAELVQATSSDIAPDQGHLHVILDDQLISMTSGLEQTIPDVPAGQHLLKVEFVASDHVPFDPRVIAAVSFETAG